MPTYDYVCQQCETSFEVHRTMAQHAEQGAPQCPRCGSPKVTRRFAPLNVAVGSRSGGGSAPSCDAGGGCCCN